MNTTTEDSFVSAWSKAKFPADNRAFVEWLCDQIDVAGFEYVPADYSYIRAVRADGARELRIHWGCTTGFTENEARQLGAGADEVRRSSTSGRGWLISHPVHRDVRLRGPASKTKKSEQRRCQRCGIYEMSVSGLCPGCDDD